MLNLILLQVNIPADTLADTVANAANATAGVPTEESLSLFDLAVKGGPVMIPLLICSIIAIYIFIERYIAIRKASKEDANFMNNIKDFIYEGKIDSAKALCKWTDSPISRMIEKGILRIGRPLSDIAAAIENVGKLEIAKLEKSLALLATLAGISPMLGFLGTVTGMVRCFYTMSKAGNNLDVSLLSGGIYEAMITTVAGLIIGIIALICYNLLVTSIQKIVQKMETRSVEFIDLLQEPAK